MTSVHETIDSTMPVEPMVQAAQNPHVALRLLRKGISYAAASVAILPFALMTGLVGTVDAEEVDTKSYAFTALDTGVQDVEVLSVESMTNAPGLSNNDIGKAVRRADKLLRFGTVGARGLGTVSIKNLMVEPNGSAKVEGVDIPCYTTDQIKAMYGEFFSDGRPGLANPNEQYMVMLENDSSCGLYKGSAAYATTIGKNAPVTVYNMQYIYQNAGLDGVQQAITHEYGHTRGLGHAPSIACDLHNDTFTDKSIQWQVRHGCALRKTQDGTKIDEYASPSSVMGDDWHTDVSGRSLPYSFLEMSRLNPNIGIEPVDPVPGIYRLSLDSGQPMGIQIKLPSDHVLGKVMPGADAIYFGLNDSGGWQQKPKKKEKISASDPRIRFGIDVLVTSAYTNNIASLDTPKDTYLGSLTEAQKTFEKDPYATLVLNEPVYIDKQLGISVTAGINTSGYFIEINSLG